MSLETSLLQKNSTTKSLVLQTFPHQAPYSLEPSAWLRRLLWQAWLVGRPLFCWVSASSEIDVAR